jgi:hypothetical protein
MITVDINNTYPDQLKGMATMIIANTIVPQTVPEIDDRIVQSVCCVAQYVLADLSNSDNYRNDKTAVLYKRLLAVDTIVYTLQKYTTSWNDIDTLNDNTWGTYYDFGSIANTDLKGYLLDWNLVLGFEGEGNYRIKIARTILGASDTLYTAVFALRNYSIDLADMTVRLEWTQDGNIIDGIDYTGCNWYQQIRVPGFFGNEQLSKDEVTWKDSNYNQFQIRSDVVKSYSLELGWIPACMVEQFFDNWLQGVQLLVTDYNIENFDWGLLRKVMFFESIEDTEYKHKERLAKYKLKLTDQLQNHIKKNS